MVEAGSIWFRLGLNSDDLRFGLDKAKYSMLEWRNEVLSNTGEMAKWGAAIGMTVAPIIAVGAAAYGTIEKFGGMAQEIKDLAYTTGFTTDKIQQLQYAATLSGTAFPTVTMGANTMTLAVAKAADASSDAAKAFNALHVSTSGKTFDQVFDDTAAALVGMKDETARNEIAMTLYGRTWKEMLPFLEKYIEKGAEIRANPILSKADLDANEKAKEQLDAFGKKWENVEGKMVSYFTKFWQNLDTSTEKIKDWNIKGNNQLTPGGESALDWALNGFSLAQPTNPGNSDQTKQNSSDAAAVLTDRFKGLSDQQIELIQTTDLLTIAEKERNAATNQADYDKYSAQIQGYKNRIDELNASINKTTEATRAATKASSAWADSAVVGSQGSEMQIFMQKEMDAGTDYETAKSNWANGTPTNTAGEGTLGAVKRKNSASSAATSPGGQTNDGSGSAAATKGSNAQKEYDAQAEALKKLTAVVSAEYKKQADIFTEHLNDLLVIRAGIYPAIEKFDLIHFATYEETAKVAYQKVLDWMAESVNFAGLNPVIQNIIMVSADGPDWTPPAFTPVSAPKLTSADFTQVGAAVQAIAGAGLGKGTSADVQVTNNITQNINGVDKDTADKVADSTTKGVSKALAGVNYLGGSMI
nr:hypothetical protein [uncultured Methanoregula sp.]